MPRGPGFVIGVTLFACVASLGVAWLMVRGGMERLREVDRELSGIAGESPAKAWKLHALRKGSLEEQEDSPERRRQLAEWETEIRTALQRWNPQTPEDLLAWARFANEVGLRAEALQKLQAATSSTMAFVQRETLRFELSLRLAEHDVERAKLALEKLRAALPPDELPALQGAVFEEAVAVARAKVEGPAPDLEAARRALKIAGELAAEPEDEEAAALARAHVALAEDPLAWRAQMPPGAVPDGGPRVVVLADDFSLGEAILPSVMRRWSKTVPVSLVGRVVGDVREGMRRAAAPPAREREQLKSRGVEIGVEVVGFLDAGSPQERALGLLGPGAAVLVIDGEGRLVGRMSSAILDPRPLDVVVARLRP